MVDEPMEEGRPLSDSSEYEAYDNEYESMNEQEDENEGKEEMLEYLQDHPAPKLTKPASFNGLIRRPLESTRPLSTLTVADISTVLEALQLGRYIGSFRDKGVDGARLERLEGTKLEKFCAPIIKRRQHLRRLETHLRNFKSQGIPRTLFPT